MNSSLDDFDGPPHDLDAPDEGRGGPRRNLVSSWKSSPIFKILLLVLGGGALATAGLGLFSSKTPEQKPVSNVSPGSALSAVPGGEAPPAYQQAVVDASRQRAEQAAHQGQSALPTPIGGNFNLGGEDTPNKNADPLAEFRRELDRVQDEQKQHDNQLRKEFAQQANANNQQQQQQDNGLTQAMRRQMDELMTAWAPHGISVMKIGPVYSTPEDGGAGSGNGGSNAGNAKQSAAEELASLPPLKMMVPAGTISYAQLLIAADSDVPGPILAQVLSGPFAGGRAIGAFQVQQELLVMTFSLIDYKGKDYPINALALDPDTTIGGMATDVDERYFSRIVLPAAANFITGFASVFTQVATSSSVSGDVVVQSQATGGLKQGLAQGGQQAAQTASQILSSDASQVKPLVEVATGTPIGLFFVQSVPADPDEARRRALLEAQMQQQSQGSMFGGLGGGTLGQQAQQAASGFANYNQLGTLAPAPITPVAATTSAPQTTTANPYTTTGVTTPYGTTGTTGTVTTTSTGGSLTTVPNSSVVILNGNHAQ